jgi:ribulose-phosphate 3-epimerase
MSVVHEAKIAPSLLSADFGNFAQAARDARSAGAEYLHFDVMDGHFVPNITMGVPAVKALRPLSDAFFDVHLMITQPERYIEDFAKAGADGITIQAEACLHLQRTLAQIRKLGAKAGVALNPATPLNVLEYVLDDIDLILVMTVNPGFGGQAFLPAILPKIRQVRDLVAPLPHPVQIEVDGGIVAETARLCREQGANVFVAGTSLYGHPGGIAAGMAELREALEIRHE